MYFYNLFFSTLFGLALGENAIDVLRKISLTFGRTLHECQNEINFGPQVTNEFMQYWDHNHPMTNRETGCAMMCVFLKLQLSDYEGNLQVPNAEGFAMASGADGNMVKMLTQLYQHCRSFTSSIEPCAVALEVADCFRGRVRDMNWTPDFRGDELVGLYNE